MAAATDTIPRLQHLVPHLGDQLAGLAERATFEDCRRRYMATAERLEAEGRGRRTASRVGDRDAYWSPTQEVLDEAMRLGFVERQPLPSARRYLDEHRSRSYELTEAGRAAAELARADTVALTTLVTNKAIAAHPYLRAYLQALVAAPIVCPVIGQGEVAELRSAGARGITATLAERAAATINSGPLGPVCAPEEVAAEMKAAVQRRFGAKPTTRPTDKALAETFNDAFAAASVGARGLRLGAIDLRVIRAWTSQWLITDQSRYVPGFDSANVIWMAADLEASSITAAGSPPLALAVPTAALDGAGAEPAPEAPPADVVVRRRGLGDHGAAVAAAVVEAYRAQSATAESNLAAPYLPIHAVRAQAAYRCGVTRALVNIVIDRLVAGDWPELGVRIHLHLAGAPQPPPSEPVYDRGGTRRYAMTLTRRPH
ncbi:MAG: hypothetical protein KY447_08030 [Actinobacteria bacterium]|nr:hypothetical protein [Actinomycetota bacterium]